MWSWQEQLENALWMIWSWHKTAWRCIVNYLNLTWDSFKMHCEWCDLDKNSLKMHCEWSDLDTRQLEDALWMIWSWHKTASRCIVNYLNLTWDSFKMHCEWSDLPTHPCSDSFCATGATLLQTPWAVPQPCHPWTRRRFSVPTALPAPPLPRHHHCATPPPRPLGPPPLQGTGQPNPSTPPGDHSQQKLLTSPSGPHTRGASLWQVRYSVYVCVCVGGV